MNVRAVCILIALIVSISSPAPFHVPCSASKLHAKLDCSGKGHALLIESEDTQYLFEDQFTFPLLEQKDPYWTSDPAFSQLLVDFQKERPPRVHS